MSISFSGLASGLDTSSWIKSLTALKQAKVTVLQEEREQVLFQKDTLASVKSFFASFRSTVEKITNAKFNIAQMDLFAQNLAVSSDLKIFTATATEEAKEGSYEIKVDKLATKTKAVSRYNYLTTTIDTKTAVDESLLINLSYDEGGVKKFVQTGSIGVTVNGIERGIEITSSDTMETFTQKLRDVGIEANYNKSTGVFTANISAGDVNDIDGTGIAQALHLAGVNEGYTSNQLQYETVETVWDAADGATKMSALGVNAGTITIVANGASYDFTVNANTTMQDFLDFLSSKDITAGLTEDGVFSIEDAEITNDGTTGLINAFGLGGGEIYSNSQKSNALTYNTTILETTTADLGTKLADIGDGLTVTNGMNVVVKNSSNETHTIALNANSTIGDLLTGMNNAGLSAEMKPDGSIEISGGTITGGSFDAISALGLNSEPFTAMASGNALTETIEVYELVTLQTRLVDDMGVKEGYLSVTDSEGRQQYLKIYSGQTISDLMADLANYGIYSDLDESTGILTITGGDFATMTDTDVLAKIADGSIVETDARYKHGTDLLTALYGATSISVEQTAVSQTYARSRALTYETLHTIDASLTTTLGQLGLAANGNATFAVRGETRTVSVTKDMTVEGLMNALAAAGIESSFSEEHSKIRIENATITSSTAAGTLGGVLGLTTEISGKYVTSDALHAKVTNIIQATTATDLSDLGITSNQSILLYDDAGLNRTINVTPTTTIQDLMDAIRASGSVTATFDDGVLRLKGGYIVNSEVEKALGLERTSTEYSHALGSKMVITTEFANETTELRELGCGVDTIYIKGTNAQTIATITTSEDMTIGELFSALAAYDISCTITNGIISLTSPSDVYIDDNGATNSVLDKLGIGSSTSRTETVVTTEAVLQTSSAIVSKTYAADGSTTLGQLGYTSTQTIVVNDETGAIGTISVDTTDTLNDMLTALAGYEISGTINNGVITLTSDDKKYVTGNLATSLGIGISTTIVTTTTAGCTNTSSGEIKVTSTIYADGSTTLGQLGYTSTQTIVVNDETGAIGTISVDTTDTLNDMLTALAGYEISGTINNGVITLTSDDKKYITGTFVQNSLGITTSTSTTTTYSGVTIVSSGTISKTVTITADASTKLGDIGCGGTRVTTVIATGSQSNESFTTTGDMTVGDLCGILSGYGFDAYMSGGVMYVSHPAGYTLSGGVATGLELGGTNTGTYTVGTTATGTKKEYTTTVVTTTLSNSTEEVVYTIVQTITTVTTTDVTRTTQVVVNHEHACQTIVEGTTDITVSDTFEFTITEPVMGTTVVTTPITYTYVKPITSNVTETVYVTTTITVESEIPNITGSPTSSNHYQTTIFQSYTLSYKYTNLDTGVSCTITSSNSGTGAPLYGIYTDIATKLFYNNSSVVGTTGSSGYAQPAGSTGAGYVYVSLNAGKNFSIEVLDFRYTSVAGKDYRAEVITPGAELNSALGHSNGVLAIKIYETDGTGATSTFTTEVVSKSEVVVTEVTGWTTITASTSAKVTINAATSTTTRKITVTIEDTITVPTYTVTNTTHSWTTTETITYKDKQPVVSYTTKTTTVTDKVEKTTWTITTTNPTRTADGNTKFEDLGMTITTVATVYSDGKLYTVKVEKTDSIDDFLTSLAGLGIHGSIEGGKVTLKGDSEAYIASMATVLRTALGYTASTLFSTTGRIVQQASTVTQTYTSINTLTTDDTFASLGLGANGTITVSSSGVTHNITVKTSDTVDDLISTLAGHGIAGSVTGGKIKLIGDDEAYITGISSNLATFLKIPTGGNSYYKTVTHTTTSNDTSNTLKYSTTNSMTSEDVLSDLGLGAGTYTINVTSDGVQYNVLVESSDTVDDLISTLAGYGIVGSVSGGKITFKGDSEACITGMTGALANFLKVNGQTFYTTTLHTTKANDTSDAKSIVNTMTSDDTFAQMGLTSNGSIVVNSDGHLYTVSVKTTDTIDDLISTLAGYGIVGSISGGKISLDGDTEAFITGISQGVADVLKLTRTAGNYWTTSTVTTTFYTNDTSNTLTCNSIMTDETTLSELEITAGNIVIHKDGALHTVSIANTATIADLREILATYNITSEILDGKLSLNADGVVWLSDASGNIVNKLGLDYGKWQLGQFAQESGELTDTETIVVDATMDRKISELTTEGGAALGVSNGSIYVYKDGTRHLVNINVDDTLETLASKLGQYGITMGIDQDGKLYFQGENDSYLTTDGIGSGASNILTKFNVSNNWQTTYDSTSQKLDYEITQDSRITGDTKLTELQDSSGNSLGITEGEYTVVSNGVRTVETITADTTVSDFLSTMKRYGMVAKVDSDGAITVGGQHESYLLTSNTSGYDTNAIATLFAEWKLTNIYTSNNIAIPEDVTVAISETTKLADINEGANYVDGYITVVKDGVQTHISLTADDTVGTLINELELYGFQAVVNDSGQVILKNTGNSVLQNYVGVEKASNILDILGLGVAEWVSTSAYDGEPINVNEYTTTTAAATEDTTLADLGVTTGEYYIYKDGVKYTALISSDETIKSLMKTLATYGIETNIVQNGGSSVIEITGKGNTYIAKSVSTTNSSNITEKLFPTANMVTRYSYEGTIGTTALATVGHNATEETLISDLDNVAWTNATNKAEGGIGVTIDGIESVINITENETIGTLLEKFRALGLEATLSNGEIMIQSGYKEFAINNATTTSNAVNDLGLAFHNDLGGYVASTEECQSTTTIIQDNTDSIASWADTATKLNQLNITGGTFTVFRDGLRATVELAEDDTFATLQTKINDVLTSKGAVADVQVSFDEGYLKIGSVSGAKVEVGSTSDSSNIASICGFSNDGSGIVSSSRELYKINGQTKLMESGVFRLGNVTEGAFTIGDETFYVDDTTTLQGIMAQINASEKANTTAYWDSIEGKLVLTSRAEGSSFINIEAGSLDDAYTGAVSNLTDILCLTKTENLGAANQVTRIDVDNQEVGQNAVFSINGTTYTSTSNTITSDLSKIVGVTINLKGVNEDGGTTTLTVEKDKETVANAVSDIVDAYNELIENVDKEIAKGGTLDDQFSLKLLRNEIRSLMTNTFVGSTVFKNLDSIGISSDKAVAGNIDTSRVNVLSFDKNKFLDAFDSDLASVKYLLVGNSANNYNGVFTAIEKKITQAMDGGYFVTANKGYDTQISRLNKKIDKAQQAVEVYRARLEAKFASMDLLIANIQNQYSSFLS